jgi:hypothetical protein
MNWIYIICKCFTREKAMPVKADPTWENRASKAVLPIRVLVGWVFLSEGIQKFLFPDSLGVGRFVKIGIPWPQVMVPFVGVVEIVCGSLSLIGRSRRHNPGTDCSSRGVEETRDLMGIRPQSLNRGGRLIAAGKR